MAKTPGKATIKDVAEAAGFSIATVSNALNGTGRLSDETRQAIVEMANRLRFRPNVMAKALIQKRSLTIGSHAKRMSSLLNFHGVSRAILAMSEGVRESIIA